MIHASVKEIDSLSKYIVTLLSDPEIESISINLDAEEFHPKLEEILRASDLLNEKLLNVGGSIKKVNPDLDALLTDLRALKIRVDKITALKAEQKDNFIFGQDISREYDSDVVSEVSQSEIDASDIGVHGEYDDEEDNRLKVEESQIFTENISEEDSQETAFVYPTSITEEDSFTEELMTIAKRQADMENVVVQADSSILNSLTSQEEEQLLQGRQRAAKIAASSFKKWVVNSGSDV